MVPSAPATIAGATVAQCPKSRFKSGPDRLPDPTSVRPSGSPPRTLFNCPLPKAKTLTDEVFVGRLTIVQKQPMTQPYRIGL